MLQDYIAQQNSFRKTLSMGSMEQLKREKFSPDRRFSTKRDAYPMAQRVGYAFAGSPTERARDELLAKQPRIFMNFR